MNNFEKCGDVRTFAAPGGGVVSGTPYKIQDTVLIATESVDATESFEGLCRGQVLAPKATGEAWDNGEKLYFNSGTGKFTTTSGGNTLAGVAAADQASGDTEGSVYLDGVAR